MTGSRPKALVTAAVSGPGLDLLHELADLVLDSWLEQPSLRIYNAAQLAERAAAEGANIVIVESDVCGADLYEQPIMAVCSCRGDPTNVDVAAATAARVPCSVPRAATRTPSPSWPSPCSSPPPARVPPDRDVREASLPRREDPLPALPGLGALRPNGRTGRTRCRWACPALAPARPGHGRPGLRPLRRPTPPAPSTSCWPIRRDLVHAPVTPETTGMIDADVSPKCATRRFPEHGTGQDPRHRRPGGRARIGQGPPRASTTSRASTWRRIIR